MLCVCVLMSLCVRSVRTVALASQHALRSLVLDSLQYQQDIVRGVKGKSMVSSSTHISDKARKPESGAVSRGVVTTDAVVAALVSRGENVVVPSVIPTPAKLV